MACLTPNLSSAQEDEAFYVPFDEMTQAATLRKGSGLEKIGMSFFKLAGLQPDFYRWAPHTHQAQQIPDYDRDFVVLQELSRLQNKFENLDLEDPIIIRTTVKMDNFSQRQGILYLDEINPKTFFRYEVFDLPVIIVMKGINRFSKIKLPPREADFFLNRLRGRDYAIMEIAVLPRRAETEKKVKLSRGNYYPLVSDIVSFSLWTNEKTPDILWQYRAPWYKPTKNTKDLLQLYAR